MQPNDDLYTPILQRKKLYSGKYLKLERLEVRLPNGKSGIREIVRVRNAVAILPIDSAGNVYLVRQHRPAIGRTIVEIPAGIIDSGENARTCALRECEEETGYKPEVLTELITYAHAEGYSTGFITLFLGTHLKHTGGICLDETEFVEPVCMPFDELLKKVKSNYFVDSKTILAALLSENIIANM